MSKRLHRIPAEALTRVVPIQVRAVDDDADHGEVTATVLRYGVIDSYQTRFLAGCASEHLAQRLPRIVWAHDRTNPVGRWDSIEVDDGDRLTLHGVSSSFAEVPDARRAWAQMRDGTCDQFSIGFSVPPGGSRWNDDLETLDFVKIELHEASPVIAGAVPGTSLEAVRALQQMVGEVGRHGLIHVRAGVVPTDLLIDLGRKMAAGELTQDEAHAALELAAVDPDAEPDLGTTEETEDTDPDAEETTTEEVVDAELAELDELVAW